MTTAIDTARLAALLLRVDGEAGGNRRLTEGWAADIAGRLIDAGVTLDAERAARGGGEAACGCDTHGDHGGCDSSCREHLGCRRPTAAERAAPRCSYWSMVSALG